jgi:hypothetical protein
VRGLDGYDEQIDAAYRAIGRYVVQFSEVVRLMRDTTCEYVAKGVVDMDLSSMLLGEATPQIIANAYFGMCRLMGELDADELKIESALRNDVKKAIESRNDIAHGDWEIGNVAFAGDGSNPRIAPPRLVRILPNRSEGPVKVQNLTIQDIDKLTARIEYLLPLIQDFGRLALKLPVHTHDSERPRTSMGEYRVRDVLVLTPGKPDRPSKITHSGPHASAVFGGLYSLHAYDEPTVPSSSRSSASD